MTNLAEEIKDPRFTGMVELLRRNGGMETFWLRYDDPSEHPEDYGSQSDAEANGPVVWMAIMQRAESAGGGRQVAAAFDPVTAVIRLCEATFDGAQCIKCGRPVAFDPSVDRQAVFNPEVVCWRAWNSGTNKFERGCG